MASQSDYELAAEDYLNDRVAAIGFDEVLQCLNHGDEGLDMRLAFALLNSRRGQNLFHAADEVIMLQEVYNEGLINAVHMMTSEDDNLNKTYDALINSYESQQILINRALAVYETEIENRLGV